MSESTASTQQSAPPQARKSLWAFAIFSLVGIAILCGLGIWQLERKAWKENLIAEIHERVGAAPGAFPPASAWAGLSPEKDEYRHVWVEGRFLNEKEAHLQANLVSRGPDDGALGYDILTPLEMADGSLVIVNRGFVPLDRKDPSSRARGQIEGETRITGLIRFPQAHPWFVPGDDPARNIWFSRDPAPIAKAYGLAGVAPVIVDADQSGKGNTEDLAPRGGQTLIELRDDHLQYALTWFALAAVLAGVFATYAVRRSA